MTEEELLAQGEDAYMNEAQLSFFKALLTAKESQIKARIAEHQQYCQIVRQPDDADSASTEEDRDRAMRLIEMDHSTLSRIRAALDAIDAGEYGYCEETGAPIGLKRLLLVPESLLSVEAMWVREEKNRHQRAVA